MSYHVSPLFTSYLLLITTYTFNILSGKDTSSGLDGPLLLMGPRFQAAVLSPGGPRWKVSVNRASEAEEQAWHDLYKGQSSHISLTKFVVLRISSLSTLLLVNFHSVSSLSNFSCPLLLNS